jgi:hypothetical protein
MSQLNTPYPATAYLSAFLGSKGFDVAQDDLSLRLALRIFSSNGVRQIHEVIEKQSKGSRKKIPASVQSFLFNAERIASVIDSVVRFLQGQDPTFAHTIISDSFLPRGHRFADFMSNAAAGEDDPLQWSFGALGIQDRAQFLSTLLIDELADAVRDGVDPDFGLTKYADRLAQSAPSFEPMRKRLESKSITLIDEWIDELATETLQKYKPEIVCITAPFPGNVYGAFRIARMIRKLAPKVLLEFGGGYVNTELRDLEEPHVFDYFDYVTLDDGETPVLAIAEWARDGRKKSDRFLRTFRRSSKGEIEFISDKSLHDVPFRDTPTPSYTGLPLNQYISVTEVLNPMHRLWSNGRWNKLTLAHGCYWKGCSFCDITLDYIARFEDQTGKKIVERIKSMKEETGTTGFHFVDEAAPPKALFAMAKELIDQKIHISWWGNIRFEKTFTPEMASRLAQSGCTAISGGLEVASDRLLKLMNKGVTVEQVARVTKGFSDAGVLVHAYLMYGFPTQTEQETIDALDRVRQLFLHGCIHSAYWHRFTATVHSPVGKDPKAFGVKVRAPKSTFARNDLELIDPTGVDHDRLSPGLHKAVYNFMHGIGLEDDVRQWFEHKAPKSKVHQDFIARALQDS